MNLSGRPFHLPRPVLNRFCSFLGVYLNPRARALSMASVSHSRRETLICQRNGRPVLHGDRVHRQWGRAIANTYCFGTHMMLFFLVINQHSLVTTICTATDCANMAAFSAWRVMSLEELESMRGTCARSLGAENGRISCEQCVIAI